MIKFIKEDPLIPLNSSLGLQRFFILNKLKATIIFYMRKHSIEILLEKNKPTYTYRKYIIDNMPIGVGVKFENKLKWYNNIFTKVKFKEKK